MRGVPTNLNRKEERSLRRGSSPMVYSLSEPRASSLCTGCSIVASRMYSMDSMYTGYTQGGRVGI